MTRRSKRELERAVDDLGEEAGVDMDTPIVIRETVVGTEWSGGELEPGETDTTVTEVEL